MRLVRGGPASQRGKMIFVSLYHFGGVILCLVVSYHHIITRINTEHTSITSTIKYPSSPTLHGIDVSSEQTSEAASCL